MPPDRGTAPTPTTLRMIWFSLVSAIVIYAVIAFVVPAEHDAAGGGSTAPAILALQIAGAAVLLAAWFVPGALLRRSSEEAMRGAPARPDGAAVPPKTSVALLVRWALLEAVAILGLLAAFIGQDSRFFVPFGVVALAGMLLAFPGRGVTEVVRGQ